MKNNETPIVKRIFAILGIVLILAIIIGFFIKAVFGSFDSAGSFIAAATALIAIPIVVWLFVWAFTVITGKRTVASADPYGRNEQALKDAEAEADVENEKSQDAEANAINTVIFDIGGVLVDFCWDDFLRNKGYDEAMVQRIGDASVRSKDWDEFDKGVLDTKGIIDGFVKNDPEIEDIIREAFADLDGLLRKRERTIPWIKALKEAGYKVLVLSNFSKQALEANLFMNEFLDEVDGGILSYRDKVIKPDRKIYELITERYNLTPSKCVFIDDLERNVEAARDFGMNGVVFESYEQVDSDLAKMGVSYVI